MEIDELSPAATLARLGDTVTARRRAEVEDLELVAHWCAMHQACPTDNRGHHKGEQPGGIRLVDIGGEGTPRVQDLSLCEVAVARSVHTIAVQHVAADVMDLQFRLPRTWAQVQALACEPWVARRVAALTRQVPLQAMHVVDHAVADAITGQSPGRVIELCQAKIIEADPAGHDQRLAEQATKRYAGFGRIDEHGLRHLIARITAGDAYYIDATLDRVADILAADPIAHDLPTDPARGLLRSVAFGWLARPVELTALLLTHQPPDPEHEHEEGVADEPEPAQPTNPEPTTDPTTDLDPARETVSAADLLTALRDLDPRKLASTAVLYLHLTQDALDTGSGVARVEGLGPHTLTQLRDLLRHSHVTVTPVIDLHERVSTAAYEFPERIRERVHLLHHGDAFPHATATHTRASRTTTKTTKTTKTTNRRHRPPPGLDPRRATRPDQQPHRATPVPATPPRQDPPPLRQHTHAHRRGHLAHPPRPAPHRRRHRHPPHHPGRLRRLDQHQPHRPRPRPPRAPAQHRPALTNDEHEVRPARRA